LPEAPATVKRLLPTLKVAEGAVVPIPTLLLVVSKFISPEAILKAVVEVGKVKVEALPADRFKAPIEVKAKVPEVAVDMVKLPEALVHDELPPDDKVSALLPVEMEEADRLERDKAPLVAVRFKAPVVRVKPLEAVKVEENLPVPVTSRVVEGLVLPIPTLPLT